MLYYFATCMAFYLYFYLQYGLLLDRNVLFQQLKKKEEYLHEMNNSFNISIVILVGIFPFLCLV